MINREAYSRQIKAVLSRIENKHMPKIYAALRSQVMTFVNHMKEQGIDVAKRSMDKVLMNEHIGTVIRDLYKEAGLYFANRTTVEINKSIKTKDGSFGSNEDWIQKIIQYFRTSLLTQAVVPITETTKEQIRNILIQAAEKGWTTDEIVKMLESPDLLKWRAAMIARTETLKAAFLGRKLAGDDSEWETVKEWISASDHRVRHSHRLVDGTTVPASGKFHVFRAGGGVDMMDGPGDPKASASNTVNCRCVLAVVAARDSNGRLIPKRRRTVNVLENV